ncbi:MAG: hypothetical protein ACFE9Z_03675 [Promethearchaeota archaeon]
MQNLFADDAIDARSKKTYAKDQSFEQDQVGEEKERYLISIELMSLKTLKDYDIMGWRGEFYFKIDGEKTFKARWPNKGTIKLQRNQEFTSKADMSLWSQFKTVRVDKPAIAKVKVILREQDHMKRNDTIAEQEFEINLPSKTEYVVLQDAKEKTKAKLRIQATRTRY